MDGKLVLRSECLGLTTIYHKYTEPLYHSLWTHLYQLPEMHLLPVTLYARNI